MSTFLNIIESILWIFIALYLIDDWVLKGYFEEKVLKHLEERKNNKPDQ